MRLPPDCVSLTIAQPLLMVAQSARRLLNHRQKHLVKRGRVGIVNFAADAPLTESDPIPHNMWRDCAQSDTPYGETAQEKHSSAAAARGDFASVGCVCARSASTPKHLAPTRTTALFAESRPPTARNVPNGQKSIDAPFDLYSKRCYRGSVGRFYYRCWNPKMQNPGGIV